MKGRLIAAGTAAFMIGLVPIGAHAQTGTVTAWGMMFSSPTTQTTELSPTSITLPGPVAQIGTSNSTEYALLTNGQVWAWGLGNDGQLGNGKTANSVSVPVLVKFPTGVAIAALATDAMPYDAALAIDTNGNAWGWGDTANGALCLPGVGPKTHELTPVQLPLIDVTALAGASGDALYDSAGSLFACGLNTYGQLGDGTTTNSLTVQPVVGMTDQDIKTIVASSVDSGVLLADGAFYDWGDNDEDQVGDGNSGGFVDAPVQVVLPLPVTQAVAGGDSIYNGSTLVELSDGTFRSWGDGWTGQLGNGLRVNEASPVTFAPPRGVTYALLAAGGAVSYAITTTGAVYGWGQGTDGELGNGGTANSVTPVMSLASGATQISATAHDVVVLTSS
jgi:alpha-tubulin suppressor-like RCC1 family protein